MQRGDFHVRSRFARPTIPEEKWGTTRSLPKQSITEFLVIQIRGGSFLFIQQVMSQHKEVCPFFPLNMVHIVRFTNPQGFPNTQHGSSTGGQSGEAGDKILK